MKKRRVRIRLRVNKKLLIIIGLFLGLALFAYLSLNEEEDDNQCVLQQRTCCPCSMGGQETCMLKGEAEIFQEQLKDCPKDIACIALYNCKEVECVYDGDCFEKESLG